MDPFLSFLIIFPVIFALIGRIFWSDKFSWYEVGIQMFICVAFSTIIYMTGRYMGAKDYELLNGEVTHKETLKQSCPRGWRDSTDWFCTEYETRTIQDGYTCTSDSKGNSRCEPKYKTQYRYIYPWEKKYLVRSNLNTDFYIRRIDPQGAKEPPRFTEVAIGDPVSVHHAYDNWVKAAYLSIFHEDGEAEEKYKEILPEYPINIYDYYKVDRVIGVGVEVDPSWSVALSHKLKHLGPQRQMNAVVVLVDADLAGEDFSYALRRYWRGFKKNDAVVVMGVFGRDLNLQWATVMSWSKKDIFNVVLRNTLLESRNKPVEMGAVIEHLYDVGMNHYERRSMKEFEFLKDEIPTPTFVIILALIFCVGGSIGLHVLFRNHVDLR